MPKLAKKHRQQIAILEDTSKRYSYLWNELFAKAQETGEFQFILNLLRFKGAADPGWDTFENTIGALRSASRLVKRTRYDNDRLNLMLWVYGHIVEASDHYEIIANMVNVAGGKEYRAWNFPPKGSRTRWREWTPNEKITKIRQHCKSLGFKDYSAPFSEALDRDLRNAVYHSDYSTYMGAVRFRNRAGFHTEYDAEKTSAILSRGVAIHEVIKGLFQAYTASYDKPKIIECSHNFGTRRAQVIVRKKHGVMALQEGPMGSGGFAIGTYKPGENAKIAQGQYLLPASLGDELNKVLDRLPPPIAKIIVKLYMRLRRNDRY